MHIVGADHHGGRPGWREGGILEELRLENAARNRHYVWELWDLLLYDKLVSEENITLLLDTAVVAAEVEDRRIVRVAARCDKTETLYHIRAAQFGDCTGDSRLALEAGAAMRWGREARTEFDESLAAEAASRETMGSSILFTARDFGEPVAFTPPTWARRIEKRDLRLRGVSSWEYGYWWIEWGGRLDTIRNNERIRRELLGIVLGVWDFIKNSGDHPTSANWGLTWVGMVPGKRESRRIEGDHILSQKDVTGENGPFPDAVAIGGWPLDDHPSTGFDDPDVAPFRSVPIAEVYDIPLRCLYSRNVDNLFMAGRNISATHTAFSSTRVMGTCSAVGQAAGTAAALGVRHGITLRALASDPSHLAVLRRTLLRDDQTIRGAVNDDPDDFARATSVTASGNVPGSDPAHVLTGEVRDIPGRWDHRWGAELDKDGAWIELAWDRPRPLGFVQITFDSGFHRELTLSEHAGVKARMMTGPQPETVRDYSLLYRATPGGELRELATVRGNHLRLVRHDFAPVSAAALRLHVRATNGHFEARIYEVRCYERRPE